VQRYPSFGGRESDSSILVNYWFWLLIVLPPALIFSVRPEAKSWLRAGRLVAAIGLGYVILVAAIGWYQTLGWHAYNSCQSHFRDGFVQEHIECKGLVPRGRLGFFLLLGWIPVIGFVGGLESLWRIWHRRRIRETDESVGEWISTVLLVLSIPTWVLGMYIFYHFFMDIWISPNLSSY
jgi:hypothetical protein